MFLTMTLTMINYNNDNDINNHLLTRLQMVCNTELLHHHKVADEIFPHCLNLRKCSPKTPVIINIHNDYDRGTDLSARMPAVCTTAMLSWPISKRWLTKSCDNAWSLTVMMNYMNDDDNSDTDLSVTTHVVCTRPCWVAQSARGAFKIL